MINVLFLCIGNSCRSQIAEGFARAYGSDVMRPFSAGLAPADIVQPETKKVMLQKNINIDQQYPKDVAELETQNFDIIVNISGMRLPLRSEAELVEWTVEDPMTKSDEIYLAVRDRLESLVMGLILQLRRRNRLAPKAPVPPVKTAEKPTRIGFGRIRTPRD
jgi:arsenate reductase